MGITSRPKSTSTTKDKTQRFIASVGSSKEKMRRKPIQLRIQPDLLERMTVAAKRRGISRAAFIVSTVMEKLEGMEG